MTDVNFFFGYTQRLGYTGYVKNEFRSQPGLQSQLKDIYGCYTEKPCPVKPKRKFLSLRMTKLGPQLMLTDTKQVSDLPCVTLPVSKEVNGQSMLGISMNT